MDADSGGAYTRQNPMNGTIGRAARIASVLGLSLSGLGLSLVLTGCIGYVQGDGGGGVVVAEPEFFWFGGYGDGHYARDYGYRGAGSRGHGGGGRR